MKIKLAVMPAVLLLALHGCSAESGTEPIAAETPAATTPAATTPVEDNASGSRKTVVYSVKGMSCEGCANAVTTKVGKIDGVVACDVSLENQRATVELAGDCSPEDVETAIRTLGYEVAPEDANPAS